MFHLEICENGKRKEKLSVPVKTNEREIAKVYWIKHEQETVETADNFKGDQSLLSLQKNETGIYECRGRVQSHSLPNIYSTWPPRRLKEV